MCIGFAACSANADKTPTTESTSLAEATESTDKESTSSDSTVLDTVSESSTSDTATAATEKKTTTTTKKSTAGAGGSDKDTSISLNEALDLLGEFYGTAYNVNATVVEDGWQYFSVTDKKDTKYASVRVNLSTADAVETIIATQEVNEFNLLA